MNIIVFVKDTDEYIFERFIESFHHNCIDKDNVTIKIYGNISDHVVQQFPSLRIIHEKKTDWYHKYSDELMDDNLLKLISITESTTSKVCLFPVSCIFLRYFSLREYINSYCNKYYYCSKAKHSLLLPDELLERNKIIDATDMNDYHEINTHIYHKLCCCELLSVLLNKYELCVKIPTFNFVQLYHIFVAMQHNLIPNIMLYDTYELLKDAFYDFNKLNSDTYASSVLSNFSTYASVNFSNVNNAMKVINILGLPILTYLPNNINQQVVLLNSNIVIGECAKCQLTEKLLKQNAYNLKICVSVSGLVRPNDNLRLVNNFLYNCPYNVYYYLSSENKQLLKENISDKTRLFNIDNSNQHKDTIAKYVQPKTRQDMVSNTCSMFYKKRRIWEFINRKHYDIIVSLRPDLLPLDGQYLIQILIKVLTNYDDTVLFIPKFYNSHGVTDSMAIGGYNVMSYYMKMYDHINTFLNKYYFNPEFLVYKYLHDNGIVFSVFDFVYKIYWHDISSMKFWWRYEFDIEHICNEYLSLKAHSIEALQTKVSNKKYIIMHPKSNLFLSVIRDKLILTDRYANGFYIRPHYDKCIRANIVYVPERHSSRELILSISDNNSEFCFNNEQDDVHTQFYVHMTSRGIHFATILTHHLRNRMGTFGRYIGVCDGVVISDMEMCENSLWNIREK